MIKKTIFLCCTLALCAFASEANLTRGVSPLSVEESAAKLQGILKDKGLKIFGVFEHSKLAKEAGLNMQDTIVVAFGAPKAGTPLMQCAPEVALELPLKILIYKNSDGQTIVAYKDIKQIAKEYNADCGKVIDNLSNAQANFFKAIAK